MQLFDLSVISSNCATTTKKDEKMESLPSSWSRGKGSCSLPLGILLYRLAHRLSLSQVLNPAGDVHTTACFLYLTAWH